MTIQQLRSEARQCSWLSLALPVVATVALLALALAASRMAPSREAALVGLSKFVWLLPLAQGLAAVSPLTGDPIVELHAATPTPFRRTLARRALIVLVDSLACSIALYVGMRILDLWGGPTGLLGILNTFGQALFLIGCAYVATSIAPSAQTVSLIVISAWIFMLFGINAVLGDVLVNRVFLILLAGLAAAIGYRRLGHTSRLLTEARR